MTASRSRRPARRVLLAVHSAKPAGAQLVALRQAQTLSADYEFVVAVGHGALRAEFAEVGETVRGPTRLPIWGASLARWALDLARAVPDALRLAAVIRRRRVRVVIANSTVLVAPVLAARFAGVPVVVHAQEAPKSAAARAIFRFHGTFADTVVAISPWIAESFGGARANVFLNPVGIPIPDLPERPPRLPHEDMRLLVVGTVDRHKRQDMAVAALAELGRLGIGAQLTLVGPQADARYAAEVRALAARTGLSNRVSDAGQSAEVSRHLLEADALLVPAGEVTPLVIMEAMALGTPVIAARMGSIPDVVIDDTTGLLVPPGDASAVAAAVARLRAEPGLAARLARGGRRHVEEKFDERRSHARLAAELGRLTAARSAPRGLAALFVRGA